MNFNQTLYPDTIKLKNSTKAAKEAFQTAKPQKQQTYKLILFLFLICFFANNSVDSW